MWYFQLLAFISNEKKQLLTEMVINQASGGEGGVKGTSVCHFLCTNYNISLPLSQAYSVLAGEWVILMNTGNVLLAYVEHTVDVW